MCQDALQRNLAHPGETLMSVDLRPAPPVRTPVAGLRPWTRRVPAFQGSCSKDGASDAGLRPVSFLPATHDPKISTAINPALVHTEASRFIRMVPAKLAFDGSRQTRMAHMKK